MGTRKKQTLPDKPVVSPAILELTRARREQVEYLLRSTDRTDRTAEPEIPPMPYPTDSQCFAGQLRLAFAAEPFVPLTIWVHGRSYDWPADDPDVKTVQFLDDAFLWEHEGKRVVLRLDSIDAIEFHAPAAAVNPQTLTR